MFGHIYDLFLLPFEKLGLARLRSQLLSKASGNVLEIGFGTGLNLAHYPSSIKLTAVEPNRALLTKAKQRTKKFNRVDTHLIETEGTNLPFESGIFDTVVLTLVFCSAKEPEALLKEAHRVLKPGGSLLLLEHTGRQNGLAFIFFSILTFGWKYISGGCHLNRDPSQALKTLGFPTKREKHFLLGIFKLFEVAKPNNS